MLFMRARRMLKKLKTQLDNRKVSPSILRIVIFRVNFYVAGFRPPRLITSHPIISIHPYIYDDFPNLNSCYPRTSQNNEQHARRGHQQKTAKIKGKNEFPRNNRCGG